MLTTYQYASNNPVWLIDIDGLEGTPYWNGRVVSENDAYRRRVLQSGDKAAIAKMRREEMLGMLGATAIIAGAIVSPAILSGTAVAMASGAAYKTASTITSLLMIANANPQATVEIGSGLMEAFNPAPFGPDLPGGTDDVVRTLKLAVRMNLPKFSSYVTEVTQLAQKAVNNGCFSGGACGEAARSTALFLIGDTKAAQKIDFSVNGTSKEASADFFSGTWLPFDGLVAQQKNQIEAVLKESGSGSMGLIRGESIVWTPEGKKIVGHIFNVVNENGNIRYLDATRFNGMGDPLHFPVDQLKIPLMNTGAYHKLEFLPLVHKIDN